MALDALWDSSLFSTLRVYQSNQSLNSDMVLELGGFIELDKETSPPSTAKSGKKARDIEKDEVILFELRPHKVLDVLRTNIPSSMVTVTARDIWHNNTVRLEFSEPTEIMDIVEIRHWEYLVVRLNWTHILPGID